MPAEHWPGRADALHERKPDGTLSRRGGAYRAEPELVTRALRVRRCLRLGPFRSVGGEGPRLPESSLDFRSFVGPSIRVLAGPTFRDLEPWRAARTPGLHGAPREATEGARWRAGTLYRRDAGPEPSNLLGGAAPNGSGGPSRGEGSGPELRGRTLHRRSGREPAGALSAGPPTGGERCSGPPVRSQRSTGPAVSAGDVAPCCRQGRARPEGGGAVSSQARRSCQTRSRPRSRSIRWRASG